MKTFNIYGNLRWIVSSIKHNGWRKSYNFKCWRSQVRQNIIEFLYSLESFKILRFCMRQRGGRMVWLKEWHDNCVFLFLIVWGKLMRTHKFGYRIFLFLLSIVPLLPIKHPAYIGCFFSFSIFKWLISKYISTKLVISQKLK